ncbi:MAG: hypothetical protein NZ898_02580 [Myxococcota bacterium]|nr:hypothetical protein [Myxococcota bacterium]MDW8361258.1 hypothetical protein [Myxococcales bacterium]
MHERFSWGRACVEIEARPGYLHVVESGRLESLDELRAYLRTLEDCIARTGLRRAIIDARGEEPGASRPDLVREMWRWLGSPAAFQKVAYVLPDPLAVARVNMTALAKRRPVRAFDNVPEAAAWLLRTTLLPTA